MVVNDSIADMLTRIRNGIHAKHSLVDMPASRFKKELAVLLNKEGYIENYDEIEKDGLPYKILRIYLKYDAKGKSAISGISSVSTPGRRVYVNHKSIPRTLDGLGITVLTTPKGLYTDREARRNNLGGEVIARVW